MNMKQVVIATLSLWLFEVFILVEGHKSIICTSTSPTNPGAFTFWVGTYHENPAAAGVPGNISIREPSGSVPTSGFSAWCSLQDCPTLPCAMNVPGIPGTATVEDFQFEMEKAGHCTAVTDPVSGEALMRTDSVLSCYEVNPGMPGKFGTAVTSGTGTFPPSDTQVQTINCNQPGGNMNGITNEHRTMYGIHIKDVKAGTYETWTFGTNADLDASAKNVAGVDTPCAMDLNAHWKYDISIADGFADCTTNVPVMGFVNPASLTFCNPVMGRKIFSGFVCSAVCNTGYTRVGVPRCFDGQWTPYMCTDKPTCDRPDLSNNASIPGRNFTPSYQYINLVTDGDPGPPTAPGCADVLTMSGTSCNYTCNLDNPGDVTCVPSKSTPITADGTGVRSQIVCGIDGNWYPGEGFCGCRTPPCDTPTPTLSLTPTFSLTPTLTFSLTLTLSLTETLSLTPTPSMTQNPLCVVFEPLGSVFCAEDDVFSIWPWLLLLLLCCVCCCLLLACRKEKEYQDDVSEESDEILPAAIEAEPIDINVRAMPIPEEPEEFEPVIEQAPLLEPEVEIGVHSIPAPDGEIEVGVHTIPAGNDIIVGVSSLKKASFAR